MLLSVICQYSQLLNVIVYAEVSNMKPLKERISVTLDSDLLEKLRIRAERDDRSLSSYINLVLRKYMEATEKKQ